MAIISRTRVSPASRASLHCRAASARLWSSMSVVVPYQFTRSPPRVPAPHERGTTDTRHRHVGGALPPHLALQRRGDVSRSPSASRGLRDGWRRATPSRAPPPVRDPYSHASVGCRRRWSRLADGTTPGWAACRGGVAGALRMAGGRRPPSPARLPLWGLGNSGGRVRGRSHGTRHRHTIRVPLPDRVSFARSLRSPHDLSPSALDALTRPPGEGCPAGAARRGASG